MLKKYINDINSFNDFYKVTKNLTNKQKGDLFEEVTKYVFLHHHYYINTLNPKNVWLYNEIPIKIKQKLNLPDTDQGIDLVICSQYDTYYAVQCKFRFNKDIKITWEQLGTFAGLTFGIADGFDGAFFVTNTIPINDNIENSNKITTINGIFFEEKLVDDFFDKLRNVLNGAQNHISNVLKPRDYQLNAIVRSCVHYQSTDNNSRGYLEMACGTGKSLTAYWINKYMDNRLTIIAVPSLNLLSQFFNDFSSQAVKEEIRHQFILVGSDADVDVDTNEKYINNGLLIDVDPGKIKNEISFLIKKNTYRNIPFYRLVIITTYQSSDKVIDALNKLKLTPDMAILDEAHKTVGAKDKQFGLLLDDKHLKINKRLFMTATPKVYDGDIDNENIMSMDDEKWYGKQIYLYNTYNAITDGFLSDYQIVTMYTDNEYINNIVEKNGYINLVDLEVSESHYVACAIMLLNAMRDGECHHLVTYHNSIKKSEKFQKILESLQEYYDDSVTIYNLTGNMKMNQRNNIIKSFVNDEKAILTSARVLNEGINIPIIDSVCFIDARTSTIDIVQCIGRMLRLHKMKIMAKVFVPTLIENINEIDENKTFGNIIRIIKSMSNTDTGINDYFVLRKEGAKIDRQIIKHKNYLSVEKVGENIDVDDWINAIDMKVWSKSDGFEYMYQKVKEWIEKNGRIPNSKAIDEIERMLGTWCTRQRKNKKNNSLITYKIHLLESLNHWYWKKNDPFYNNYNSLKKWIDINNKIPSKRSKEKSERKLGQFCSNMRMLKTGKYKKNKLPEDRIKLLEELPNWYWAEDTVKNKKYIFTNNYNSLKKWIDINNKIPSNKSKVESERKLGQFCSNMRMLKTGKYKKNKLSEDRIELLKELPYWYWSKDDKDKTNSDNQDNDSENETDDDAISDNNENISNEESIEDINIVEQKPEISEKVLQKAKKNNIIII